MNPKIENAIKEQIHGKLLIDDKYLIDLKKKKEKPKEPVLRAKPPKNEKLFEMQYSDYLPLISNVSLSCGNKLYKNKKKEN